MAAAVLSDPRERDSRFAEATRGAQTHHGVVAGAEGGSGRGSTRSAGQRGGRRTGRAGNLDAGRSDATPRSGAAGLAREAARGVHAAKFRRTGCCGHGHRDGLLRRQREDALFARGAHAARATRRGLVMNEPIPDSLEERGRRLFDASVENVDMRIRSRLNQARHAALDAAARPRARLLGLPIWTSAAGVTAAGVLAIAIWFGSPLMQREHQIADNQNLEDLEIVASTDEGAGDAMEMLQDDIEFYDWAAEKTAAPESGSVG